MITSFIIGDQGPVGAGTKNHRLVCHSERLSGVFSHRWAQVILHA